MNVCALDAGARAESREPREEGEKKRETENPRVHSKHDKKNVIKHTRIRGKKRWERLEREEEGRKGGWGGGIELMYIP
jgi:hypothetical protein